MPRNWFRVISSWFMAQHTRGSQKGFASIFVLAIICIGIILGVFLINKKTNLFPRATVLSEGTTGTETRLTAQITDSSFNIGSQITITWENVDNPELLDWIALLKDGAPDGEYIDYFRTSSCNREAGKEVKSSGSCVYAVPYLEKITPGIYEFRLFRNDDYTLVTKSNKLTKLESSVGTITLLSNQARPGQAFKVSWKGFADATTHDWIAMYKVGADNKSRSGLFYTATCSGAPGQKKVPEGSCYFGLPESLTEGEYEFRYLPNDGYISTVKSLVLKITTVIPSPTAKPSIAPTVWKEDWADESYKDRWRDIKGCISITAPNILEMKCEAGMLSKQMWNLDYPITVEGTVSGENTKVDDYGVIRYWGGLTLYDDNVNIVSGRPNPKYGEIAVARNVPPAVDIDNFLTLTNEYSGGGVVIGKPTLPNTFYKFKIEYKPQVIDCKTNKKGQTCSFSRSKKGGPKYIYWVDNKKFQEIESQMVNPPNIFLLCVGGGSNQSTGAIPHCKYGPVTATGVPASY